MYQRERSPQQTIINNSSGALFFHYTKNGNPHLSMKTPYASKTYSISNFAGDPEG